MKFKILAVVLLAAAPLQAKPRTPRPGAEELILKMLAGPTTGYAAVERVQIFIPGKKPKALKALVAALPGGRVRREVLPPKNKTAPLIQVRSGRDHEKPAAGLARLLALYDLSVSTGGVVAKRKTWRIEMRLKNGILRRTLWLDRDSGLMMKRETRRDDGSLSRRERIVKLELPGAVDPALFAAHAPPGPWTPDGFVLIGERGGVQTWSDGVQSYAVARKDGVIRVTGDLAEDDAARVGLK